MIHPTFIKSAFSRDAFNLFGSLLSHDLSHKVSESAARLNKAIYEYYIIMNQEMALF